MSYSLLAISIKGIDSGKYVLAWCAKTRVADRGLHRKKKPIFIAANDNETPPLLHLRI